MPEQLTAEELRQVREVLLEWHALLDRFPKNARKSVLQGHLHPPSDRAWTFFMGGT